MRTKLLAFRLVLVLAMLIATSGQSFAQFKKGQFTADAAVKQIEGYQNRYPAEKVYLHLDRNEYFAGDTIWFKAYVVQALNKMALAGSTRLTIELLSDDGRPVERRKIIINNGTGYGDIALDASTVPDGTYRLRAYTNWGRNFDEATWFSRPLYIGSAAGKVKWMVTERHTVTRTDKSASINLDMQLTDMQHLPIVNDEVEVQLARGNKRIVGKRLSTLADGTLKLILPVPADVQTDDDFNIIIKSIKGKNSQAFPITIYPNGREIDLQFLSEGGQMVAGLLNRIAFKAIGPNGMGIQVSGKIVDSKNEEVQSFSSLYNGMGNVRLLPLPGETYRAVFNAANGGKPFTLQLPPPQPGGTVLRVDNLSLHDTVNVYIAATPDLAKKAERYVLLAQAKDTVLFAMDVNLSRGFANFSIPSSRFKTGIACFTLLDDKGSPVNERRIFINGEAQLNATIQTASVIHRPKDSIAVDIEVTDQSGKPVAGNFSVAVTNDGLTDTNAVTDNIVGHMLLTSELKGTVERPSWYFEAGNAKAQKALDNLMLTQGWAGFSRDSVKADRKVPLYEAENGNTLSGKLINFLHKPVEGAKVTLLAKHGPDMALLDTVTNKDGRFNFDDIPELDSVTYTLKFRTKGGSSFGGGITVNEITPASPSSITEKMLFPWYVNTKSLTQAQLAATQANANIFERLAPNGVGRMLNNVTITAKRIPSVKGIDGQPINYHDLYLDEKQLVKIGRKTLLDYLETGVKGFHTRAFYKGSPNDSFIMDGNFLMTILIDGVDVRHFYSVSNTRNAFYNHLRYYLDAITAADVKEMVIYHEFEMAFKDYVSLMIIKTRSGQGPATRPATGMYVYRPEPVYRPREFYKPRYTVNSKYDELLSRPTIHWEPNIVTDASGKAKISFYAGPKPSSYTINIQGTDLQGKFLNHSTTIRVTTGPLN